METFSSTFPQPRMDGNFRKKFGPVPVHQTETAKVLLLQSVATLAILHIVQPFFVMQADRKTGRSSVSVPLALLVALLSAAATYHLSSIGSFREM